MMLQELVARSAATAPEALAVAGPDGTLSYRQLDRQANRLARALASLGVRQGDRVGLWAEKSTRTVVAMQAALRLGAAYLPLDTLCAPVRNITTLRDCGARALFCGPEQANLLGSQGLATPDLFTTAPWKDALSWDQLPSFSAEPLAPPPGSENDLAYILCTSGSTGVPKYVCLSHRNALAFVGWASCELQASSQDRFANHAPFHFDLSVFDLYVAFMAGASVHLVPEAMVYAPRLLVDFLSRERISVWYSVPSALMLMEQQGELLETALPALRAVLFAGEPYPVRHLYKLWNRWAPRVRFLNLYGPTETNVCTFYEIRDLRESDRSVPIGLACSGDRVWARKEDGTPAGPGEEGILLVQGPTVMIGYWGQPPSKDDTYITGDWVRLREDGAYDFLGRRDNQVKVRGQRIELGEIESALIAHPQISAAAIIAAGSGLDRRLVAYLVPSGQERLSLLAVKQHCAACLPRYMIVDAVHYLAELPRTSNGKVDRRLLQDWADRGPAPPSLPPS